MAYLFNMWHAQSQALKQKPEDPNHPVHISGCSYTSTSGKEVLQKGLKDSHSQVLSPGSAPILMVPTSLGPLLISQTAIQLFHRFELKQRDREQDLCVLCSGTSVLQTSSASAQAGNEPILQRQPPGIIRRERCGLCPGIPTIPLSHLFCKLFLPSQTPNSHFLPQCLSLLPSLPPSEASSLPSVERGIPGVNYVQQRLPQKRRSQAEGVQTLSPLLCVQTAFQSMEFKAVD